MKIAYLCTDSGIPVLGGKGASVHIREIVANLNKIGNEVFIVAACKGGGKYPGFNHNLYEVKPFISKRLGSDLNKILTNIKFFFLSIGIFSKEKPEAIYERYEYYCFAGILLAKLFSIPHLLEINAALLREPRRRLKFYGLARLIESIVFRLSNGVIITTLYLKGYAKSMGAKDNNIHIISGGVDIEKFTPLEKKDKKLIERLKLKNSFVIGFVGTLMPRQGLEVLIGAAEGLKRKKSLVLTYLIIGDGRMEKKLKSMVQNSRLEEDFIFLKNVRHEDIPAYISVMDVCVLPNTSIYSSPIKIFEYMAIGKPIIAPRKGQVQETIEDGKEGILITPGDKEELEKAIIKLYKDEKLREIMGRKAREKVERNYTWKHGAERIMGIYSSFLK